MQAIIYLIYFSKISFISRELEKEKFGFLWFNLGVVDIQFFAFFNLAASTDGGKFLLAARRCRHPTHTDYIISLYSDDLSKGSSTYVGKLRYVGLACDVTGS